MSETTSTEATQTTEPTGSATETFDYPTGTALSDMTVEQRAEYWREKAQKHEKQWQSVKGTDAAKLAQDLKTAQAELDKMRQASMSEQERAVAEAKAAGRSEANAEALVELVRAKLEAKAAGKIPAGLLEVVDTSRFVTSDGKVDAEAIAKFVEDNATAAPDPGTGKPDLPDFGQGKRGDAPALNSTQLERDLRAKLGIT